jgi:hypothetical protein
MYASVRRYKIGAGQMDELMERIDTEFASMVTQAPGFVAYHALDCGDDVLMTISLFRDEAGAESSIELAADYVRDNLQDYDITRTDAAMGAVVVSRAESAVLEPAHH